MCFTCGPVLTIENSGFTVAVARVADDVTSPRDFGLPEPDVESFEDGEWYYVGVSGTIYAAGRPLATETIHGVPERGEDACALSNTLVLSWIMATLIERANGVLTKTLTETV